MLYNAAASPHSCTYSCVGFLCAAGGLTWHLQNDSDLTTDCLQNGGAPPKNRSRSRDKSELFC